MGSTTAVTEIGEVITRGQVKARLLQALTDGRKFYRPKLNGDSEKANVRRDYLARIRAGTLAENEIFSVDQAMEAILYLDRDSASLEFIVGLLHNVGMKLYGSMTSAQATRFRSAVCHLDQEWFGPQAREIPAKATALTEPVSLNVDVPLQ
jgi:hypothetical protein